jgi:hypothetical protein
MAIEHRAAPSEDYVRLSVRTSSTGAVLAVPEEPSSKGSASGSAASPAIRPTELAIRRALASGPLSMAALRAACGMRYETVASAVGKMVRQGVLKRSSRRVELVK